MIQATARVGSAASLGAVARKIALPPEEKFDEFVNHAHERSASMYKAFSAWVYSGVVYIILMSALALLQYIFGETTVLMTGVKLMASTVVAVVIGDALYRRLVSSGRFPELMLLVSSRSSRRSQSVKLLSRSRTFVRSGKNRDSIAVIASVIAAGFMGASFSLIVAGQVFFGLMTEIASFLIGLIGFYYLDRFRCRKQSQT